MKGDYFPSNIYQFLSNSISTISFFEKIEEQTMCCLVLSWFYLHPFISIKTNTTIAMRQYSPRHAIYYNDQGMLHY